MKSGVFRVLTGLPAPVFTLVAGEDTGSAIAQNKSGKANYPGDRQEILADIPLQIQPLPHCATQIVHRIVELPTLFGGARFENFCW